MPPSPPPPPPPGDPWSPHGESPYAASPGARLIDPDADAGERTYAMWIHIGPGIAWLSAVFSGGVAFFIPGMVACILWLIRRHDSPFLDDHGRQALNFQISLVLLFLILIVATCGLSILFLPLTFVFAIAGAIPAAISAHKGEYFRYPMTWQFLK